MVHNRVHKKLIYMIFIQSIQRYSKINGLIKWLACVSSHCPTIGTSRILWMDVEVWDYISSSPRRTGSLSSSLYKIFKSWLPSRENCILHFVLYLTKSWFIWAIMDRGEMIVIGEGGRQIHKETSNFTYATDRYKQ